MHCATAASRRLDDSASNCTNSVNHAVPVHPLHARAPASFTTATTENQATTLELNTSNNNINTAQDRQPAMYGVIKTTTTTTPSAHTTTTTGDFRARCRAALVSERTSATVAKAALDNSGSVNGDSASNSATLTSPEETPVRRAAVSVPNCKATSAERPHTLSPALSARTTASSGFSYITYVSSRPMLQSLVQRWQSRYGENKACYKEGGYLNVIPGKLLQSRYVMIQKLGWGEFSTVWLAYDTMCATLGRGPAQAFVAVKVAKCHASVQASSLYEMDLLRYVNARLPRTAPVTNLIDSFEVAGEFGTHLCMVMPVHGSNLLAIIDQFKAKRERRSTEERLLIKECLLSTLTGLKELHGANVIHTDIKPENVLCNAPDPSVLTAMETFCKKNSHRSNVIPVQVLREHLFGHALACEGNPASRSSSTSSSTCDSVSFASAPLSSVGAASVPSHQQHLVCLADLGLSAVLEPLSAASTPVHTSSSSSSSWSSSSECDGDCKNRTAAALAGNLHLRTLLVQLTAGKAEFQVAEAGRLRNRNGVLIQTREYRAPEVLLGLDFTTATDLWSIGCMTYELITGDFLMDPKRRFMGQSISSATERQIDIEHAALIQQLLGPLPSSLTRQRTRFNAYYEARRSNPRASATAYPPKDGSNARQPPVFIHRYVDETGAFPYAEYYASQPGFGPRNLAAELAPYLGKSEAMQAASFILMCLGGYDPAERASAKEALTHPWLQGVGKRLVA